MSKPNDIDELLESLSVSISNNHINKTGVGYAERRKLDDKWCDEAKQALYDLMSEVIGEDGLYQDPEQLEDDIASWNPKAKAHERQENELNGDRNDLRAEQRQAINQLFNRVKGN